MMESANDNEPLPRDHYLYLTKAEWAAAWIKGGSIPLFPASTYLSVERSGTSTPDEMRERFVHGPGGDAVTLIEQSFPAGFEMTDCVVNMPDGSIQEVQFARTSISDSLILCFSLLCTRPLMKRLGKECVLRMLQPDLLSEVISAQLGVPGGYAELNYTCGPNRGHDFKGWEDRWQAEARLFWTPPTIKTTWVEIPPGIAELVDIQDLPEVDPREAQLDHGWYDREIAREARVGELLRLGKITIDQANAMMRDID